MPLNGVTWLFHSALAAARCWALPVLNSTSSEPNRNQSWNPALSGGSWLLSSETFPWDCFRADRHVHHGQWFPATWYQHSSSTCYLQSSVLRRSSILTYWSLNVTEQLQLHYHLHLCSWVNSAHHTGVIQIPGHSCCNFIITVLHQNPEELIQDYRKEIHNHMDLLNPQQILWRR